jgi:hypothetical protein
MGGLFIKYDNLIIFIMIITAIIVWVFYQIHNKYQQLILSSKHLKNQIQETLQKLHLTHKNLTELQVEQRTSPHSEPRVEPRVQPRVEPRVQPRVQPPIQHISMLPPSPYYLEYPSENFQLVGYVSSHRHPDQMFRLMGRQYHPYKYEYYVIHPYTDIKIPIRIKNDWEINTGDQVQIPGFKGDYTVQVYDNDHSII